jgi:GNAT superfamily N-acetyltransferase
VTQPAIRPGRDEDAAGFITLIGDCWAEYPGVILDVDNEMSELRALASHYAGKGGALWAAEQDGRVVGMIGAVPHGRDSWEIVRLYVAAPWRGSGLAHRLLDAAETCAVEQGAARLLLWSDTRFTRAHRFYEKRSFVRSGPMRVLEDVSGSLEFAYAKPVNGIAVLNAGGVVSAIPRLAEILSRCVAEGAGVSFLPPLAPDTARAFWRGVAKEVAAGTRILICAWHAGVLAGVVSIAFARAQNQPYRADVEKLLVHPNARGHGLARALMQRAEQEAARAGRTLLTLDTRAGDRAEGLYRSLGWNETGRVPGYAVMPDGSPNDTLFFWKRTSGS